jgi:hypothetical protein
MYAVFLVVRLVLLHVDNFNERGFVTIPDILFLSSLNSASNSSSSSSSTTQTAKKGRVFLISDIHGLNLILRKLIGGQLRVEGGEKFFQFTRDDTIIIIGDLADRGDDHNEDKTSKVQKSHNPNMFFEKSTSSSSSSSCSSKQEVIVDPPEFSSYETIKYAVEIAERHAKGENVPAVIVSAGNHERMLSSCLSHRYFREILRETKTRLGEYFIKCAFSYAGEAITLLSSADTQKIKEWISDPDEANLGNLLIFDEADKKWKIYVPVPRKDGSIGINIVEINPNSKLFASLKDETLNSIRKDKRKEVKISSLVVNYLHPYKREDYNEDIIARNGSAWVVYDNDPGKFRFIVDYFYKLPSIIVGDGFLAVHAALPQGLELNNGGRMSPSQLNQASWGDVDGQEGVRYADIEKGGCSIVYTGHIIHNYGKYLYCRMGDKNASYYNIDVGGTITGFLCLVDHTSRAVYLCDKDSIISVPKELSLPQAVLLELFRRLRRQLKTVNSKVKIANSAESPTSYFMRLENIASAIDFTLTKVSKPNADLVLQEFKNDIGFLLLAQENGYLCRCFYRDTIADLLVDFIKTKPSEQQLQKLKGLFEHQSCGAICQYAILSCVFRGVLAKYFTTGKIIENFDDHDHKIKSLNNILSAEAKDYLEHINILLSLAPVNVCENFRSMCLILRLLIRTTRNSIEKNLFKKKFKEIVGEKQAIIESLILLLSAKLTPEQGGEYVRYFSMLKVLIRSDNCSADVIVKAIKDFICDRDVKKLNSFLEVLIISINRSDCVEILNEGLLAIEDMDKKRHLGDFGDLAKIMARNIFIILVDTQDADSMEELLKRMRQNIELYSFNETINEFLNKLNAVDYVDIPNRWKGRVIHILNELLKNNSVNISFSGSSSSSSSSTSNNAACNSSHNFLSSSTH